MSNLIWVDKYRPKTFDEIIGQDHFVKRIREFVKTKNMPHLLLAGRPGTGKTTTALVVARELYGDGGQSGNYLELNASDDRGIDVIRNQIKTFAKLKSLVKVPYKIICLDEADSLTKEAQQALRRTMERYSHTCRFILACNEISKLIDPIQSRCVIFKFKNLDENSSLKLVESISKEESLEIDLETQKKLYAISKGDVRKLVNTLQAASSIDKKITLKLLDEIVDFVDPKEVQKMIDEALKGNFDTSRDYMLKLKIIRGFTGIEIIKEIYSQVISMKDIEPKKKVKIIDKIATIEFRLVEGADEEIQIESLLAMIALIK